LSRAPKQAPSMIPGQEAGEKFMAVLLWAQGSSCTCPACNYLREMASDMVSRHVKEAKPVGSKGT